MYTISLSCEHQAGQNRKPRLRDWIECPVCKKSSQVIDIQEHRRDAVYGKLVAADFSKMVQRGQ